MSDRELMREIKSNSYERLIDKPEKIEIIFPQKNIITTNMKNPIIIEVDRKITTERELELSILANLVSSLNNSVMDFYMQDTNIK